MEWEGRTCFGFSSFRACPTDILEMIPWGGAKAKQIASAPIIDHSAGGSKRCESVFPLCDFLSNWPTVDEYQVSFAFSEHVRVY